MEDKIMENKVKRFKFLKLLYEVTGGNQSCFVNMWEVGQELGYDRKDIDLICQYLKGEGLIEYKTLGGGISITHWGVMQIEEAVSKPEKKTQYFPSVVNIINVEQMNNSQIQQGSDRSGQTFNQNSSMDFKGLELFLEQMKKDIEKLNLPEYSYKEAMAKINTVASQVSSPKPKNTIIQECLKTLRIILEGAAGSIVATGLLNQLDKFIK